jgi:hypothetical protein
MPDPNPTPPNPNPAPNPSDPNPGTGPVKTPTGTQVFDPTKISDEDFNKVFEDNRLFTHPRFKALNERAKKADELEKAHQEAERKALEDQGKWKEAAELAKAEAEKSKQTVQDLALRNSIQLAASKLGIVDVEAAAILVDRSSIKVDDNGIVSGADEALQALLTAKPYLKGAAPQQPIGTGSNPSPGQTPEGTKKFTLSQIQDHAFYKEHEKDIMAAMAAGLVEDDTKR